MGGAVVDAAYWHDFMTTRGIENLKSIHGTDRTFSEFAAWADTPTGKEWRDWRRQWEKDHPKESGVPQPP